MDVAPKPRAKVLFVEPDSRLRVKAATALEPAYEFIGVADASQALPQLDGRAMDLVIVKHPLPAGSGLELLRQARARQPDALRVVATELRTSSVLIEAVNDARVAYILRSPWEQGVLRELIDGLCGLLGARRQQSSPLGPIAGDSSSREAYTGVLTLPSFFRHAVRGLGELAGAPASILCAEIDAFEGAHGGPANADPAQSPQLRVLAACMMEAALAFPGSHTAKSGSRILAFLARCEAAAATEVAEQVVAAFARATCQTVPATASVGIASHPRHAAAPIRLIELADEALGRAQRMGGSRAAECLPRLLMVGPLAIFQKVISSFTRRQDMVLKVVDESHGLAALMESERPSAILANLLGSRAAIEELQRLTRKPEHKSTRVVFVTPKPHRPEYTAKAAVVLGSVLVCGPDQFVPRTLEAVARAMAIATRKHPRIEAHLPIQVVVGAEGASRTVPAVLSNFTREGALVHTGQLVRKDESITLVFAAQGLRVELQARVVRVSRLGIGEYDFAARFDRLPDETLDQIAAFAAQAPPLPPKPAAFEAAGRPAQPRARPERLERFKVRLRPVGQSTTGYLQIASLSPAGCVALTAPKVAPPVREGSWAEAMIFDRAGSVRCLLQITQEEQRSDGRWLVTGRFGELPPQARAALERMLGQTQGTPFTVAAR